MKTLVIHPDDRSTDFLREIYVGKGYTVVTDTNTLRSKEEVTKLIKEHGRIMMMGHGHPGGLFFTCINSSMAPLLREKLCVCIWCNADKFVEKYGLKGFYTGMFISEVSEAKYFGIKTSQEDVTESNDFFTWLLRRRIDSLNVLNEMKSSYIGESPVIQFNNERLYEREENEEESDEPLIDYTDDLSEMEQPFFDDTDSMERDLADRDLQDEFENLID